MMLTKEIVYQDEKTVCRGFIAYDDSHLNPRPCVMIAHDWGGRHEDVCNKARQLSTMGFVGFAIDMYGQAQLGNDKAEKSALMTALVQDRKKLAARILAAFNTVAQLPQVDNTKIAAIGYCFGGLCVLDLARTGVDVKGVVSFHGLLTAPEEGNSVELRAKILVLHGYDDPLVLPEQVNKFASEMTARKADWQIHIYDLTAHSFTNPDANDDEMGLHYNPTADRRSWVSMELFLKEVFAD
jgi:dienelactone hydrolase